MGFLREKPRINKTLIPLKVVVFFVISGITALHVLHATKPQLLGLNFDEYRSISILAPFISILGPLIVGPLADRLAAKNSNTFGRTLRFLTAFLLIIAALIYACLFAVPDVQREEARRPSVSFGCNANGAVIFQERCAADATCHNWKGKIGSVNLTKCTYNCQDPSKYENMYTPWLESVPTPSPSTEHSSEFDYEDESTAAVTESLRTKRAVKLIEQSAEFGGELMSAEAEQQQQHTVRVARAAPNKVYVQPPHLCITEKNDNGDTLVKNCHVYTDDTPNIIVHSVLRAATNIDNENDTHSDGWCKYPLDGFQCSIPAEQAAYMIQAKEKEGIVCKPMIECQIIDPYDSKGSVLADSECMKITGDLDVTLGGYTAIRLIGDIFPMAALTLLNTAIVIAVRETSEGRGEVCRQYAWGAIGYVLLFSPLDAFFFRDTAADTVALILVIVCFLLGALVLIFANNIPLSPPEWWWHTKTGVMVYPMSAIRRYSPEIFVLTLVAVLFGTFWSSIHTYLRWTFSDSYAVTYSGLLLVLALLWNVDKFIEYCGHSNIFIGGFGLFIIRFTALSGEQTQWLTVVMEILEPLYIGVIWITIILYMRHAMPRKLTATGQAICVAAFFCLGKGLGALIGLARDEKLPHFDQQAIHQWLAVAACIIALAYFVMYNLILAPRCTAKPQHNEELMSGASSQNFNGNGNGTGGTAAAGAGAALNGNGNSNYSPLRVYHNERGKKGQFRY